jgi:hypothetical protein
MSHYVGRTVAKSFEVSWETRCLLLAAAQVATKTSLAHQRLRMPASLPVATWPPRALTAGARHFFTLQGYGPKKFKGTVASLIVADDGMQLFRIK